MSSLTTGIRFIKSRKFELEGTLSVIFSIKKYRLLFCVPNVFYSYDHFFPVKSIKFQLENLEKVEFNGFLWLTISEIFQISAKYARLKQISSMFLYSKHLEATHSLFVFCVFCLFYVLNSISSQNTQRSTKL